MLASYEQQPPIPLHYWVQKLAPPFDDGTNMIMKIQYLDDSTMPTDLNIYYADSSYITFKDDGVAPDERAGDRIYSAYIKEDINEFTSRITGMEANLTAKGSFLNFQGHVGQLITQIPHFDLERFNALAEVEVDAMLINGIDCGTDLLKKNSLFITDLSVVEDQARTHNIVTGNGPVDGVWTFGHLIKNIANEPLTGVSARTLLKNWIKGWTDGRTINGQIVPPRTDVLEFLILSWITKARGWSPTYYDTQFLSESDKLAMWENDWDGTPENDLLNNAPFKLMAIVNRLDLRENTAYNNTVQNSGETRFIFTLIAPYDNSTHNLVAGMPPQGFDGIGDGGACTNRLDWKGMNVILEFGNLQTSRCALRDFAQQWLDLSAYTLGSVQYNDALEAITDQVTAANAAPNKPNGSALDQIRTNERIFAFSACGIQQTTNWDVSNWELSQFELNANNHLLEAAPVSNTPNNESNMPSYLFFGPSTANQQSTSGGTQSFFAGQGADALIDWMFLSPLSKQRLILGNHKLPLTYSNGNDQFYQAATAIVDGEQLHYWDINWQTTTTTHYINNYNNSNSYPDEKKMRQQLSLNTCQGCHTGETKTFFTQVTPQGYGQSANYWDTYPDGEINHLDKRFARTVGQSKVNGTLENNHTLTSNDQFFQNVSAFLTGRVYHGNNNWQDDLHQSGQFGDDASDPLLDPLSPTSPDNLFYVYDPSDNYDNGIDQSYPKPDHLNGYNDLLMRKQKLCQFINTNCSLTSLTMNIIANTANMPLPHKGH